MWFGMWWWLVPLLIFLAMRSGGRRMGRRATWESDRSLIGELRQQIESQRSYIDELETRLSRVEDGLEFTERLLAGGPPARSGDPA